MAPKSSPKKSPKSALTSGKFKSSITALGNKKDKRNQMIIEGLQQGVLVIYMKKWNKEEEAFLAPDVQYFNENPDIMESLGIHAIVYRRGIDGETALPQSDDSGYNWKQFVCIIGESVTLKEEQIKFANKLIEHFNNNKATAHKYQFFTRMKLGADITMSKPCPLDACLLDTDVVGLMEAAFPDEDPNDIAEYDDIMCTFWTNLEHGKSVIENAET